jgi:hypothetical protein
MRIALTATLAALAFAAIAPSGFAQPNTPWTPSGTPVTQTPRSLPALPWLSDYRTFRLDAAEMRRHLDGAPLETAPHARLLAAEVPVPMPDGTVQRFLVTESPIMSSELQARIPVRTYAGRSKDDPYSTIRLSLSPEGFHGYVMSPNGDVMIDPVGLHTSVEHVSYFRRNNGQPRDFKCFGAVEALGYQQARAMLMGGREADSTGGTLKTFRLAMNTTGEYTNFFGGVANAQNRVVISVNRVTGVYERDIAIRLNLTYINCYPDPNTDPFSNNNGGAMLSQNQSDMDAKVGNANYDIGHVFSTGGGGVAGLGVVGVTGQKARGVTGSPQPFGDPFDIDYVAHEMGHQFGAHHTFAGTAGSCSGNGTASSAYEPGSGSTIMAYAGICGSQNVQNFSDPYFHTRSFDQIFALRQATSAGIVTNNGGATPIISAGPTYTIPRGTPFKLTAVGSHPQNLPLTYCWEQYNLGTTDTTRPIFRSRNPSTSPTRFLPRLEDVLSNLNPTWEPYVAVDRWLTFRVTARDNMTGGGGSAYASTTINVSGNPFRVTSPNTAVTWGAGETRTVTWDVGGGSVASHVNILLSTNGGMSYATGGAIMLKANTPNDGSEPIQVPFNTTGTARIIVEAVGNIFYDVSDTNFTITNPAPVGGSLNPNSASAGAPGLTLTVNGSGFVPGSVVRWNGANRTTTFVNANQLTATLTSADLASPGSATVTVSNPAPGGGTSAAMTFTVVGGPSIVSPSGFTILSGTLQSGSLASLSASNNQYLEIFNMAQPISVEFTSTSPVASPSSLTFSYEGHSTAQNNLQALELWDFVAGAWVLVDSRPGTTVDSTVTVTPANPARFVQAGTGTMRAKVSATPNMRDQRAWVKRMDLVSWTVAP